MDGKNNYLEPWSQIIFIVICIYQPRSKICRTASATETLLLTSSVVTPGFCFNAQRMNECGEKKSLKCFSHAPQHRWGVLIDVQMEVRTQRQKRRALPMFLDVFQRWISPMPLTKINQDTQDNHDGAQMTKCNKAAPLHHWHTYRSSSAKVLVKKQALKKSHKTTIQNKWPEILTLRKPLRN